QPGGRAPVVELAGGHPVRDTLEEIALLLPQPLGPAGAQQVADALLRVELTPRARRLQRHRDRRLGRPDETVARPARGRGTEGRGAFGMGGRQGGAELVGVGVLRRCGVVLDQVDVVQVDVEDLGDPGAPLRLGLAEPHQARRLPRGVPTGCGGGVLPVGVRRAQRIGMFWVSTGAAVAREPTWIGAVDPEADLPPSPAMARATASATSAWKTLGMM